MDPEKLRKAKNVLTLVVALGAAAVLIYSIASRNWAAFGTVLAVGLVVLVAQAFRPSTYTRDHYRRVLARAVDAEDED